MVDSLQYLCTVSVCDRLVSIKGLTIANENSRILCSREMTKTFHGSMLATRYLVCRSLAHVWCIRPVVLARQHVDRARLGVNLGHPVTAIPSAEVEVQISVENSIGLSGIHVPDQLSVDEWCCWAHHAIDPFCGC